MRRPCTSALVEEVRDGDKSLVWNNGEESRETKTEEALGEMSKKKSQG